MPQTQSHPLQEAADQAHRRLEQMTPEQLVQTLKEAGILTPDGKLAPEYGGDEEEEPEDQRVGKQNRQAG